MRIQLIIITIFFAFEVSAVSDKDMNELFKKYESVMDQKKVALIDEVFSEKFIKESGGKDELILKIKELTPPPSSPKSSISWKKGQRGDIYLARMKEINPNKSKLKNHEAEFIVVEEKGKLKIDGTISDGN